MTDEVCGEGWWDGKKGHVCRTVGPHDVHECRHCGAQIDDAVLNAPAAEVKTP